MTDSAPIAKQGEAPTDLLGEETHLVRLLNTVNSALGRGDSAQALRYLDRARRTVPSDPVITQTYGQLLLKLGDARAALTHLTRAAELRPGPEVEAAIIEALLALGRGIEAAERLDGVLHRFALVSGGSLQSVARAVLRRHFERHGWIGLTPDLELTGEAWDGPSPARIELCRADGSPAQEWHLPGGNTGAIAFGSASVDPRDTGPLRATLNDNVLLGGLLASPPDFMLDGRAEEKDGMVSGWVSLGWNPMAASPLTMIDAKGAAESIASMKALRTR